MRVLTELEMVRLYSHAKNQRIQLKILSQIQQMPIEEVMAVLERHGVDLTPKTRRRRKGNGRQWNADPRTEASPEAFYKAFERLVGDYSHAYISSLIGISPGSVSRYLCRKGLPSRACYDKILEYVGMESEEFLG